MMTPPPIARSRWPRTPRTAPRTALRRHPTEPSPRHSAMDQMAPMVLADSLRRRADQHQRNHLDRARLLQHRPGDSPDSQRLKLAELTRHRATICEDLMSTVLVYLLHRCLEGMDSLLESSDAIWCAHARAPHEGTRYVDAAGTTDVAAASAETSAVALATAVHHLGRHLTHVAVRSFPGVPHTTAGM